MEYGKRRERCKISEMVCKGEEKLIFSQSMLRSGEAAEGEGKVCCGLKFHLELLASLLPRGMSSLFPIKPVSLQSRKPLCPGCCWLGRDCPTAPGTGHVQGTEHLALLITPGDESATPCQAFLLPLFLYFFFKSLKSTRNSHAACLTLQQNYCLYSSHPLFCAEPQSLSHA